MSISPKCLLLPCYPYFRYKKCLLVQKNTLYYRQFVWFSMQMLFGLQGREMESEETELVVNGTAVFGDFVGNGERYTSSAVYIIYVVGVAC